VNIAARLEGLAKPGGVLVSNTVYDHVRDRLPFALEDMSERQVKNIARPVRVYALRPGRRFAGINRPANPQPTVAPRLSIVVLPFCNLSNDPEQQYFADGITEDVTTDLWRLSGMLVISRNTAFTYQGQAGRPQADRARVGGALCAGRQRPSIGQPSPHKRSEPDP
jgi:hypothetical protein